MTNPALRARVLAPAALFLATVLAAPGCAPKNDEVTITTDTTGTATTPAPAPAPGDTTPGAASSAGSGTMPVEPATPPDHIQVQHVLIGFQGKIPGKNVTRTQAEAEKLAQEILERARRGEDFDTLVQTYTDDAFPGVYGLSNRGVDPVGGEVARDGMVKGFSDVAFSLSPGNIGMSNYDPQTSPYGWHIIKRLR